MEQNRKEQSEKDPTEKGRDGRVTSRRERRRTVGEQANIARTAWVTVCCLTLFACGIYMGLSSAWENAPPVLTPDYTVPVGTEEPSDPTTFITDPSLTVPPGEENSQQSTQGSIQGAGDSAQTHEDATQAISLVVNLDDLTWPCFGEITQEPGWFYFDDLGEWHYVSGVKITGESRRDVRAALSGKVSSIALDSLLGKVLVIDHGSGVLTEYGGIDVPALREGDPVSQGQTIAILYGQALTCRITKNGNVENPADYLTQAR